MFNLHISFAALATTLQIHGSLCSSMHVAAYADSFHCLGHLPVPASTLTDANSCNCLPLATTCSCLLNIDDGSRSSSRTVKGRARKRKAVKVDRYKDSGRRPYILHQCTLASRMEIMHMRLMYV